MEQIITLMAAYIVANGCNQPNGKAIYEFAYLEYFFCVTEEFINRNMERLIKELQTYHAIQEIKVYMNFIVVRYKKGYFGIEE